MVTVQRMRASDGGRVTHSSSCCPAGLYSGQYSGNCVIMTAGVASTGAGRTVSHTDADGAVTSAGDAAASAGGAAASAGGAVLNTSVASSKGVVADVHNI